MIPKERSGSLTPRGIHNFDWRSWSSEDQGFYQSYLIRMFSLTSSFRYYLYRGSTDMRKPFDGLSGLVQSQLKRNPMSGEVFIFINRRRTKVKLLRWEQGGFILYYKRLESGTFELPKFQNYSVSCQMSWTTLMLMVEGISFEKTKRRKRFFINNYTNYSW